FFYCHSLLCSLHSFPTRRSSDLASVLRRGTCRGFLSRARCRAVPHRATPASRRRATVSARRMRSKTKSRSRHRVEAQGGSGEGRSEEHTSELQSLRHLVCRLLLE